jgi:methionyl-tRNA synthetase
MSSFYITTPIYYANTLPHLGHLYTTIVADCVQRYKRQRGFDTYFLTGTDEHGINIERAAKREGRTPKQHVDYVARELQRMFEEFHLDGAHGGYDIFMRTTAPFHYEGVSHLWREAASGKTPKGNDPIYKGHYEGWFCAACAAFKTEDEYFKPTEEGQPPLCMIHEISLDRISEESYFFRLSDYDEVLLELYETNPDFVRPPGRRNEVISFVKGGLQDLSISRMKSSVSWGIPVPGDPDHTMFVWFDALSNYATAIGYGNEEREQAVGFEKYWPAVHLIGKDILRQHAIYWPAFLMAAGVALPKMVFAHGLLLDPQNRKMSKTIGNTVELPPLREYFPIDGVRYFCLREVVFGQDGKIGYETLIDRINSDLASGLGNLSSRTLSMISKYCAGVIPSGELAEEKYLLAKRAGVDADPQSLSSALEFARDQYLIHFDDFSFSRALEQIWQVIARVDKMLSDAKPWILAKDEEQREVLHAVLYRAAETLRWLSVLLYPVMPEAARSISVQLAVQADVAGQDPATLRWGGLKPGTSIGEVLALFPRLDKFRTLDAIQQEKSMRGFQDALLGSLEATLNQPEAATGEATANENNLIDISDFAKVELRVGEILTAERIPKSDKLLRFTVDVGEPEPRQILAGIAEYYSPEEMVGRKVVVVANLPPRKLRGFESQGMICAASYGEEGRPVIATFTEQVPNGARLK